MLITGWDHNSCRRKILVNLLTARYRLLIGDLSDIKVLKLTSAWQERAVIHAHDS